MTEPPYLCPACLAELPPDYPYDHVRIDRAISGDADLFKSMPDDERREVITTGRERGLSDYAISKRLRRASSADIAKIMGENTTEAVNQKVAEMWARGLGDYAISVNLGYHRSAVAKIRERLGLASLYGPGGRPKTGATA